MSAVRVESKALKDPRFTILGKELGTTKFDARARMIELWAYCTENYTYIIRPDVIDVLAEFDGFANLICKSTVNLGEKTKKGVRIRGTEGRIEWLEACRSNGKKGGRPEKKTDNLTLTKPKPNPNQTQTKLEPESNLLTLTPALVPVIKEKTKTLKASASLSRPDDVDLNLNMKTFIGCYVKAFQSRYGPDARPELSKKVQGQIKTFLKEQTLQRAMDLIQVYFQIDDRWISEIRCHDFGTFISNIQKISLALDTGKVPTADVSIEKILAREGNKNGNGGIQRSDEKTQGLLSEELPR